MSIKLIHIATSPLFLNFLRGHINYVRERDIDVHVVTSPGELLNRFSEQESLPAYAVKMPRNITPLRDAMALWRLYRLLGKINPHIVHAHTPKGGLLGIVAGWLCRVPVRIYHIRGLPFLTASGAKRTLLWWSERVSCTLSHQVLCVSHSIRQIAVEERLCPANKIKVLGAGSGQGVDAQVRFNPSSFNEIERSQLKSQLSLPDNAVIIGYVGRIVRDKGICELAEAWRWLRETSPRLYLLLVGDYEEQDPVPEPVRHLLNNDPRVRITGWVDDTAPYYALMHLLVLPTHREGFPNAPLEAAAMELPVVATKIPGCIDAVQDGITGTLVPPRDPDALGEAIARYVEDEQLRLEHGRAGRQRVLRDFRPEYLWQAVYQEYLRLLGERGLLKE